MNGFDLPTSIDFCGQTWEINADFRNVLLTLEAFEDPNLTNTEKAFICIYNIYKDFERIPSEQAQDAFNAAVRFIDLGQKHKSNGPRTMDWTQDSPLIFPAVNAVAGCEVRALEYMHWWTFFGYFMEIRDSTASTVFSLRNKKAKHKKLEKWENDYWNENKHICEIHSKLTEEEQKEKDRLNRLLG